MGIVRGHMNAETTHPETPASNEPAGTFGTQLTAGLRVLRDRWWVLPVAVVLFGMAGLASALKTPSRYKATATLAYTPSNSSLALIGNPSLPNVSPQLTAQDRVAALNTLQRLATTSSVERRVRRTLSGNLGKVSAVVDPESNLVRINVVGNDPQLSATVANAWAKSFVFERARNNKENYEQASRLVTNELAARGAGSDRPADVALRQQLSSLKIAAALQQSDAQVADTATVPTDRISPNPVRDGVLGAIAGLLLAIVALALVEALDRRLKTFRDAEKAWGVPLLASFPLTELSSLGPPIQTPALTEAFRHLQSSLRFVSLEREVKVVAVTSAVGSEGKSTISFGLAQTLAATGYRTLLIDADFRHPTLTRLLELDGPGLSDLLANGGSVDDAIRTVEVVPGSGINGTGRNIPARTLEALGCGAIPPNPFELLSRQQFVDMLAAVRDRWDYVIIDCAPLLPVSDTTPVLAAVDGAVAAVRLYHSQGDSARRAVELAVRASGHLLGIAVAGPAFGSGSGYGYGYGYGYGDDPASVPPSANLSSKEVLTSGRV